MIKIPKGLRLHIGVFGRRNVGKSSILNALVDQEVSIVSEIAGTTTDPVEKVMELKPIGPVVFIDTAGVDDEGALGRSRVDQTMKVMQRTELALLVTDRWGDYERRLLDMLQEKAIPVIVVANKADLRDRSLEQTLQTAGDLRIVSTSATRRDGIDLLREGIVASTPESFLDERPIIGDLIHAGDVVVLVTPIDIEAPKGRLKMLQVHCLREILDSGAWAIVTKETELPEVLERLTVPPDLVVCDSQIFHCVIPMLDPQLRLTTFSMIMARYKGDLDTLVHGAAAIQQLRIGDRVLIAEACTHHPIGEDIGRVQIPHLLREYVGGDLEIEVCSGRDFPKDVSPYQLIIHCGACVFNRKEMLSRIQIAEGAGIPITNYGTAITLLHGQLDRALVPLGPTNEPSKRIPIYK